ncbi:MAG: LTA synthase family protein [Vagococcus sp.]
MQKIREYLTRIQLKGYVKVLLSLAIVLISNYYLQLSQNEGSFDLATKFAFSWHTEKFLLGSLVLLIVNGFMVSLSGSFLVGTLFYVVSIVFLGIANYMKMSYRMEPIYPDDLKMLVQWTMLKDILGTPLFVFSLLLMCTMIAWLAYSMYHSIHLPKKQQRYRVITLVATIGLLGYVGQFNRPNNLLRQSFDRTALWISYSQKMNYYNTGFMGGFLFNLKVEGMDKPLGYSKQKIDDIVTDYEKRAIDVNRKKETEEQPNIVYIMSESFSDPTHLNGIELAKDPLSSYKEVAEKSVKSGQMLSQNYGGGTANIEFEALTGMSMALLNSQMTTPYTMMLPKQSTFPSVVSNLKKQGYETTAIHPYNTSMYKRKDVYQTFGFDTFLDETTMTYKEKLSKNGFISDESAFRTLLDILNDSSQPQFVHLVTMQTHMPYNTKYTDSPYSLVNMEENKSIQNYAQDIAYTSDSLKRFVMRLNQLDRPTKFVFWGDHLPSIYPDDILKKNKDVTAHLTEFLIYDTRTSKKESSQIMSPFYFPSEIAQTNGIKTTGFTELLTDMYQFLPAFEQNRYYYQNEWKETVALTEQEQKIFDTYRLIQYDLISGEKYSLKMFEDGR